MLTAILGFWTGLPAPVRKLAEYAGIVLLALWCLKVFWLNGHDNRIEYESRTKATEQVRKEEEAKWKAAEDRLKADNALLAQQVASVQAANLELERSRGAMLSALNTSITQSKTIQEVNRAKVDTIAASDLVGAVRQLSNELAGAAVH